MIFPAEPTAAPDRGRFLGLSRRAGSPAAPAGELGCSATYAASGKGRAMTRWVCVLAATAALVGRFTAPGDQVSDSAPTVEHRVVIDIDGSDDIRIGGDKHTLTSLRRRFDSAPPSHVVVRKKGSATGGLQNDMASFLTKSGLAKDLQLGNEQAWVSTKHKGQGQVRPTEAKSEVVIDIDGTDDVRIGEKRHSLTSLCELFGSGPPSRVVVRQKGSTTFGLQGDTTAFLTKLRYAKDSQLGNEQVWSIANVDKERPPAPTDRDRPESGREPVVGKTRERAGGSNERGGATSDERQSFGKIKLGMTEAEVRQLLPSTPKESASPDGYKVLTWGSDSDSISVLFADGRVSTIERGSKSVDIHWGRIIGLASAVLIVVVGATVLIIRRRRSRSRVTS